MESTDPKDRWIDEDANDCAKKTDFDKWIDSVPESGSSDGGE